MPADAPRSVPPSSRRRTRESGVFVRDTPGVQSLERGLQVLRAFRPGITSLSNAELAERTGFPRATVSRLAATLVSAGFLDHEAATGLYRLGAPFLGLGLAVRSGSAVLQAALPFMREVSEGQRINVGLALADDCDVVYLDSVRKSQLGIFRHIIAGTRLPMAETALGQAWLAGLAPAARKQMLSVLAQRYADRWGPIRREISGALAAIGRDGYCSRDHRSGVMAVATPLALPGHPLHALNISYRAPADDKAHAAECRYGELLLQTAERIRRAAA
ncbi:IclR family transcriptional regulator [Pseudorhodoferax soli]|nr:IclR family transcriptional regulator [Pseudorhodoferax soli]